jgi:hypothetical protein
MIKVAHLYGVEAGLRKGATQCPGAPSAGAAGAAASGAGAQARGVPNHGATRPPSRGTPAHRVPIHRESGPRVPIHGVPRHGPPNQQAAASRHPGLTREQVFRLWQCAIKDDERLVDDIIERIYENIVAFDCKRAESVIELIVRRSITARWAFRSLLNDMRAH